MLGLKLIHVSKRGHMMYGCNLKSVIFKIISRIDILTIACEMDPIDY